MTSIFLYTKVKANENIFALSSFLMTSYPLHEKWQGIMYSRCPFDVLIYLSADSFRWISLDRFDGYELNSKSFLLFGSIRLRLFDKTFT